MDVSISTKVHHEYVIGSSEDVKHGNVQGDVVRTFDLEEALEAYQGSISSERISGIAALPNLIGVYRRAEIRMGNSTEEITRHDVLFKPSEGLDVHPGLVQIGFNPNSFDPGVLREYIGEESRRMIIVPYLELTPASEAFTRFSALLGKQFDSPLDEQLPAKDVIEMTMLAREILPTDGLTKPVYDALMDESRIITL